MLTEMESASMHMYIYAPVYSDMTTISMLLWLLKWEVSGQDVHIYNVSWKVKENSVQMLSKI